MGEVNRGSITSFKVESLISADRRGFWGVAVYGSYVEVAITGPRSGD